MRIERLGDVTELIDYGLTASARVEGGPKFLRITDIQDGAVDWSTVPGCDAVGDVERYTLCPGDIVFARTGATTGKSFLIRDCPHGAVFASYLIRVRPSRMVHPSFLARYFESRAYWGHISANSTGSARPGVNASKLRELPVPVPPLPEQRRIAAILDEADALRRKRREALGLLDDLLRSAFLEMFGDPVTNPRGWPVEPMSKLVSNGFRNGLSPSSRGTVKGTVLTLSAVTGGAFDSTQLKDAFFDREPDVSQMAADGTFLICRGNGNIGLVGQGQVARGAPAGTVFPDTVIACRPRLDLITTSYLVAVWSEQVVRSQIEAGARTTNGTYKVRAGDNTRFSGRKARESGGSSVGRRLSGPVLSPALNQQVLASVRIPVPPSKAQSQFDAVAAELDREKAIVRHSVSATESLFASLLQRAFSGGL